MLPDTYEPRTPPFDHQSEALETGWQRTGFGYLLEMGLGKTRVAIDDFCLNHVEGTVDGLLIVAPKSVYTNWTREDDDNPGEIQKWMWEGILPTARIHAYRAGKGRQDEMSRVAVMDVASPGVRVLAINAEALSSTAAAEEMARAFLRAHRCMMLVDESTIIKSVKSRRTKVCLRLAKLAVLRRILTGSPTTGSMEDLWPQFEFLGPGQALLGHRLFSTFRARYCVLRDIHVGSRTIKTVVGSQNVDELRDVVARHSFRRRKKDCLDLPEKTFERRDVELTKEQLVAYEELRRNAMTVVNGAEVTTQIVMTQLMRMHQVVCGHIKTDDGNVVRLPSNRLAALAEVVAEARANGESVVIWCNYRPDIEEVVTYLRKEYGAETVSEWHGGVPSEMRERGESDFQAGRSRFMVASQQSGGRGRTWTAASVVVYYSNNYDLELREQSEDRTHRIGQTSTVTYVDLVVPKSVDEKIIKALRGKKDVARQVLADGISAWI